LRTLPSSSGAGRPERAVRTLRGNLCTVCTSTWLGLAQSRWPFTERWGVYPLPLTTKMAGDDDRVYSIRTPLRSYLRRTWTGAKQDISPSPMELDAVGTSQKKIREDNNNPRCLSASPRGGKNTYITKPNTHSLAHSPHHRFSRPSSFCLSSPAPLSSIPLAASWS